MIDWYGADDEPLGHWEVIDNDEWTRLWTAIPYRDLAVFAAYTEMDDDGTRRDVRTEWGIRGDDAPRLQCHEGSLYGPYGVHSRFVLRDEASA